MAENPAVSGSDATPPNLRVAVSRTPAEEAFDRLARLTGHILSSALAFVAILDEDRSYWQSRIDAPPAEVGNPKSAVTEWLREYLLDYAGPMLVSDALTDPTTRDNLSVRATGLRSWASFHLRSPRGVVLGILCVADHHPREWTEYNLEVLEALADAAASEVTLRDTARRSAETAEVLQLSMLTDLPDVSHVQLVARYLPAREAAQIGGDWYDAFVLPDGVTAIVIGDVAGHDLPAAAQMGQLRNLLRGIACHTNPPPGEVLAGLDAVSLQLGVADVATAVYARVEGPDGGPWQMRWANAGHPPPLLIDAEGTARYLDEPSGLLLGLGGSRHTDGVEDLPPGCTVLLYTDGLVESRHTPIDVGLELLRVCAEEAADLPLDVLCDRILTELAEEATDDVTLLALRVPLDTA